MASGRLALLADAQGLGNAVDRGVPIGRRGGRGQVEGAQRIAGAAAVAKNAGAG